MRIIITDGAGFIGSAVARYILNHTADELLIMDSLTYAGRPDSLALVSDSARCRFEKVNICDVQALTRIFAEFCPDAVIHLAAESHVDHSIEAPDAFIETSIAGTYRLLKTARQYWLRLPDEKKAQFRFLYVSTDEALSYLDEAENRFAETTSYTPGNPYSVSKVACNYLACAWQRIYDLPVLVTNSSNNYGPCQNPEKFIPLTILNALEGKPLSVYGGGEQIHDWLYVEDHARALYWVLTKGGSGQTYAIGGQSERKNIDVVREICRILDELAPADTRYPEALRRTDHVCCRSPQSWYSL